MTDSTFRMMQSFPGSSPSMTRSHLVVKDPVSAGTHAIGAIASLTAAPFLIMHYVQLGADSVSVFSVCVFLLSMILLYSASALYHTVMISPSADLLCKKIDHMMIFILIAGSYTPFCLITLRKSSGILLFCGVWIFAVLGIIFKFFWVTCPKWVSSVIYIAMGWLCVFAVKELFLGLKGTGFFWLLAGGIIYTVGGVIYALKLSFFNSRHTSFGSHEIFHLFVMAGSFCHFLVIYNDML